jgi:hypothetical protein
MASLLVSFFVQSVQRLVDAREFSSRGRHTCPEIDGFWAWCRAGLGLPVFTVPAVELFL